MAKNSKSDAAQLQAVLGYLKNDGAPYWSGSIDGIWTEELAASLRQFQSNNGLPPTGYLSPNNEDKTRQKIIQRAAGTPYANMRGLWGAAIVFSLVDVPTIYVQKQIEELGPWQDVMTWAYRNSKTAAGLYSLPLNVDPKSLKIVMVQGRAHLSFAVTYDNVKWFSNASRTWSAVMPREALDFVSRDISNDQILIGSATSLQFYSKASFDFFKAVPKTAQEIMKIMKLLDEYEKALAKQEGLREKIRKLIPEVQRIVAEFQKEWPKIQKKLDEQHTNIVKGVVLEKVEKAALKKVVSQLGSMGKNDWKIVVKGIGGKLIRIIGYWDLVKAYWDIGEALVYLPQQFFIVETKLKPLANQIKKYESAIDAIQKLEIDPLVLKLKKHKVRVKELATRLQENHHEDE